MCFNDELGEVIRLENDEWGMIRLQMEFVRLKREDAMGQSEKRCWMEFGVEGQWGQKIESGEMLITEGPIGREECASFQRRSETLRG